ncbi:lysophospholipase L1-like esterase [Sphingomonas sp. UYAg733]
MKLFAAIALLSAPGVAAAQTPAPCTWAACDFDTLAPYFAKLSAAHDDQGAPLHIIQIGDSNTASDTVTGGWRDLLQAQVGSGGRGILPPGRPYGGYVTHGITASMSTGWRIAASLGKGSVEPRPPLGVSSYSLTATRPGAAMSLVADAAMLFDRFVLCGITGPDAGAIAVRIGAETERRIDFHAAAVAPICHTMRVASAQSSVSVTSLDRPVTITSWATFRDHGGMVLSNLGVVGSQLIHFGRTDDAVLAAELKAYAPDLIVLAFGTNEGFVPLFDAVAYETVLRAQIARIRRLAGEVPILMISPPEALTRNRALRHNASGTARLCAGLTESAELFAPPALIQVRSVQRRVAAELRLASWDAYWRMGGFCSAATWARETPPRMRRDYVHFTRAGGAELAQRLQDDLNHATEEQ